MDKGHIENLWEMFKTIDDAHSVSEQQVEQLAADGVDISQEDAQLTVRLYAKAAKACSSAEDFRKVVENDEFPPVNLTEEEMEFAKGGRRRRKKAREGVSRRGSSGVSSGSCHGENNDSGPSRGSCHGESR
ncbi:MAG: hypothetical protein CMH56_10060 [Myxococcales bacterium]|nr:hypothetical protein [Myxococcales bacterium]|tara:strand:- start:328 stop:720 length:393 start_codon:yes stop_codon:yes gene_type:complete